MSNNFYVFHAKEDVTVILQTGLYTVHEFVSENKPCFASESIHVPSEGNKGCYVWSPAGCSEWEAFSPQQTTDPTG